MPSHNVAKARNRNARCEPCVKKKFHAPDKPFFTAEYLLIPAYKTAVQFTQEPLGEK